MAKKFNPVNLLAIITVIGIAVVIGRYYYTTPAFIQGEYVADFTANLPNGESIQFSDLKGKFVLLDFWGSWCGPCIQENPKLKRLNQKYAGAKFKKATGFEIVSVGIEESKERWLSAIKRYGLNWKYHVSDFKNLDSDIAKLYGVRVIPTKFLINDKGIIMGVNPTFEEIEAALDRELL